jgi:hypothetical protein
MRAFSDYLETVAAADSTASARNLTSTANVKTVLNITTSTSDALIDLLIPRVSKLIVDHCLLAPDAAGGVPTFARETLRATWHQDGEALARGCDLFLPWRVPIHSIDAVVEDGVTRVAGTDYLLVGARPGCLRRISNDVPVEWSTAKIVVTFKAGFDVTTSLATNIDPAIEAAAIEQVKSMFFAASRDPALRSENVPDVAAVTWSSPGGDTLGALTAPFLLPSVRDMLAPWRRPRP